MVRRWHCTAGGSSDLECGPRESHETSERNTQADRRMRGPCRADGDGEEMRRRHRYGDAVYRNADHVHGTKSKAEADKNMADRSQRLPSSRGTIRHDVGEQRVVGACPPDDLTRLVHPVRCQPNVLHRSPLPRRAPDHQLRLGPARVG